MIWRRTLCWRRRIVRCRRARSDLLSLRVLVPLQHHIQQQLPHTITHHGLVGKCKARRFTRNPTQEPYLVADRMTYYHHHHGNFVVDRSTTHRMHQQLPPPFQQQQPPQIGSTTLASPAWLRLRRHGGLVSVTSSVAWPPMLQHALVSSGNGWLGFVRRPGSGIAGRGAFFLCPGRTRCRRSAGLSGRCCRMRT